MGGPWSGIQITNALFLFLLLFLGWVPRFFIEYLSFLLRIQNFVYINFSYSRDESLRSSRFNVLMGFELSWIPHLLPPIIFFFSKIKLNMMNVMKIILFLIRLGVLWFYFHFGIRRKKEKKEEERREKRIEIIIWDFMNHNILLVFLLFFSGHGLGFLCE